MLQLLFLPSHAVVATTTTASALKRVKDEIRDVICSAIPSGRTLGVTLGAGGMVAVSAAPKWS